MKVIKRVRSNKNKQTRVWSKSISGNVKLAREQKKNRLKHHYYDIYYPEYDGIMGSGINDIYYNNED